MQPIVATQHLVTYWGERRILQGINLAVMPHEILVIMGGSGSGKSTLLRHLLGLHRPAEGSVLLFGENIDLLGRRQRHALYARIGMSFQGGALFNSLTVGENIALPMREHTHWNEGEITRRVEEKLSAVKLQDFANLTPSELSGGMLKRAALARAIALDPPLLFFDEPSAGLDPVVAAQMDDLILHLRDTLGTTIIVVTHELESTFKIADRVLVLDAGAILFDGSIDELRNSDNERIQNLLNRRA